MNLIIFQIYQLHCLIKLKRITSLDDFMEAVEFDTLGVDTIDFIIIIGSVAIEFDDIKDIAVINSYIKNMDFTGVPYFDMVLKDLQIEIEKKSGGLKMLLHFCICAERKTDICCWKKRG